ncbi:MAG: hypothetical protein USCAAHI_02453 [Beijerinckiaceae bacterium]|nr:MAG: hypothetical protein USCAAHI_02453 [Beijerinckiaceae bacterium]
MVSMDYAFVESDGDGHPLSSELWVDTWDMPLPEPVVSHAIQGDKVEITIHKSAWFFPGQTAFQLEPANTFITRVDYNGFREVVLEFDDPTQIRGTKITFDTKNVFYFYRGTVSV